MEYQGIVLIFTLLAIPFIFYFIYLLDVETSRHNKIIQDGGREKRQAAAKAFGALPSCVCVKCGHEWRGGGEGMLPLTCPSCGKRGWWWGKEDEYHHYSFLTSRGK